MVALLQFDLGDLWKNLSAYNTPQLTCVVVVIAIILLYAYFRLWMRQKGTEKEAEQTETKEERSLAYKTLLSQLAAEGARADRNEAARKIAVDERDKMSGELARLQFMDKSVPALRSRAAELEAQENKAKDASPPKRARLLLVEDEEDPRTVLSIRLMQMNYEVAEATNGKDALERCEKARQSEPFDAILTDEHMPEMSGQEFVEELRKADDATPVIFLTGAPKDIDLERMAYLGVTDVLGKPAPTAKIQAALQRILE